MSPRRSAAGSARGGRGTVDLKELVPDWIQQLAAYPPGMPLEELEREYGLTGSIKLASNENPFGPSPRAVEAIVEALPALNRYPDGSGFYLRRALAERFGVPADAIILGPGDIFTSVLPNLLVEDVAQAINESDAVKIHVCNLMTKPNESGGFHTSDFLALLTDYLGTRQPLDFLLVNNTPIPGRLLDRYAAEGQYPVELDVAESLTMAGRIVERPLLAPGVFIRHNPAELAAAVMEIVMAPIWNGIDGARQDAGTVPVVIDCDDFTRPVLSGATLTVDSADTDGD